MNTLYVRNVSVEDFNGLCVGIALGPIFYVRSAEGRSLRQLETLTVCVGIVLGPIFYVRSA